jgi:hypothetical protein
VVAKADFQRDQLFGIGNIGNSQNCADTDVDLIEDVGSDGGFNLRGLHRAILALNARSHFDTFARQSALIPHLKIRIASSLVVE